MKTRKPTDPIVTYSVYPLLGRKEYYDVVFFKNRWQMMAYARNRKYPSTIGSTCQGLCSSWTTKSLQHGRITTSKQLGEILLVCREATPEVITHEATHAALAIGRRLGWDLKSNGGSWVSDGEEKVCYTVGWLVRDINWCQGNWTRYL